MSLLCRLGFHQTFGGTLLTNWGSDESPFYYAETYETCNRCGWTTRPNPTTSHGAPERRYDMNDAAGFYEDGWRTGYQEGQRDLAAKVEALADSWRRRALANPPGYDGVALYVAASELRALLADALPQDADSEPASVPLAAEDDSGAPVDVPGAAGLSEAQGGAEAGLADCGRRHPGPCATVRGVCLQPSAETRDGGAGL